MPKAASHSTAEVIKFPTRRVADARHVLPLSTQLGPEAEALEQAWRSARHARAALLRQQQSILARLHALDARDNPDSAAVRLRDRRQKRRAARAERQQAERHLLPLAAEDGDRELGDVFASIPAASRDRALAVLEAFARASAGGAGDAA